MAKRLKILLSVYACSPVRGSEPGMGWGFVKALAAYHDLWVITEKEKFQQEIQKGIAHETSIKDHVKFYFLAKKRHRTLRKIWPPSYYWFYRQWHKSAFNLAVTLDHEIKFDVVHQLNMVGFREPGFLWKLDRPFVWGPIGGLVQMPLKFLPSLGGYGFCFYLGRNIYNWFQSRYLLRPKIAARRAGKGLISATQDTANKVEKLWDCKSNVISEIGLPGKIQNTFALRNQSSDPFRIVWSGQHQAGKALNILLYALAMISAKIKWKLEILGQGKETNNWKQLAADLGINSNCKWHGWIKRNRALEIMQASHCSVITSLKDLTSTVTVEALSNGLPVICLDHCGFADAVTDSCGIKIAVTTPKKVKKDLADAIMLLANDEELRKKMALAALERAKDFDWDIKAQKITQIYHQVIADWKR